MSPLRDAISPLMSKLNPFRSATGHREPLKCLFLFGGFVWWAPLPWPRLLEGGRSLAGFFLHTIIWQSTEDCQTWCPFSKFHCAPNAIISSSKSLLPVPRPAWAGRRRVRSVSTRHRQSRVGKAGFWRKFLVTIYFGRELKALHNGQVFQMLKLEMWIFDFGELLCLC